MKRRSLCTYQVLTMSVKVWNIYVKVRLSDHFLTIFQCTSNHNCDKILMNIHSEHPIVGGIGEVSR